VVLWDPLRSFWGPLQCLVLLLLMTFMETVIQWVEACRHMP